LGLEAGIDGPGILGMYWYETVMAIGRVAMLFTSVLVTSNYTDARRRYGGGMWDLIRGVRP
jgi:hypothetical protein